MILVDTSVWIDHLRSNDPTLSWYLEQGQVLMHPFVLGELACGNVRNRESLLTLFALLPKITVATDVEVLFFIKRQNLMGKGIGYIDMHLLAATALSNASGIWTRDKRLLDVASQLGLHADIPHPRGNVHDTVATYDKAR
jgi:predicted nucleic acid-binding protein